MTLERLIQNFEILTNWEERYRYLIELGRKLPKLPEEFKTEENRVKGCTSRAWFVLKEHASSDSETIEFIAESDASIVQGLIAILMIIYSGKTTEQITQIDIRDIFVRLGLQAHLSPSRRNGFFAMVERIKHLSQVAKK